MYGVSVQIKVKNVLVNEVIHIEWDEPLSSVEWQSTSHSESMILVCISSWGLSGNEDEIIAKTIDSMGGFTLVLAGLKALLEHNIILNLVADHHPTDVLKQ